MKQDTFKNKGRIIYRESSESVYFFYVYDFRLSNETLTLIEIPSTKLCFDHGYNVSSITIPDIAKIPNNTKWIKDTLSNLIADDYQDYGCNASDFSLDDFCALDSSYSETVLFVPPYRCIRSFINYDPSDSFHFDD